MPCKHAALAAIYAQQMAEMDEPWKLWQFRNTLASDNWNNIYGCPDWDERLEYRQIPKTIKIGNFDIPEPMREKPEIGSEYFYVSCSSPSGIRAEFWHDSETDNRILDRRICHLTRDNCILHARALFSFSEIKEQTCTLK